MRRDFHRIAIVNRGDPAIRFIEAVRQFNRTHGTSLVSVALYAEPDARARFVREANEAIELGTDPLIETPEGQLRSVYMDLARLEQALRDAEADAAWTGWGFVSEQPEFVELCERLGITALGPRAATMRLLGDKVSAKRLAAQVGVPIIQWAGGMAETLEGATAQAQRLDYPVVIKPARGGGGRGIRVVRSRAELVEAFNRARDEGGRTGGSATVFLERWLGQARHIEVQIAGDGHGSVLALGVRECSVQRRHQKLIEEAPAPGLAAETEQAMREAAVRLCRAAGYSSVGTVEFLYDQDRDRFWLLEVNTRLQVEHAVTEMTTGIDLVALQIAIARGARLDRQAPLACGHAVEVRLNAEDAGSNFAAAPGCVRLLQVPTRAHLRLDSGVGEGDAIQAEYDSMFGRLIAWGETRDAAIRRLEHALGDSTIVVQDGVSNRAFLLNLLSRPELRRGPVDIDWLERLVQRNEHVSHAHADVALLAAAAELYDREFLAERDEFFASAARQRPVTRPGIGRVAELTYRGQQYRMRVCRLAQQHYRVDVDGVRVDLQVDATGPAERWITYRRRRHRIVSMVQGLVHLVEVERAMHRISRDEAGIIRALAPAVVVSLPAREGARVAAGDRLAVLEAMKMEAAVTAPFAGVVERVFVLENAHVAAGAALVRLAAREGEPEAAGPRVRFEGHVQAPRRRASRAGAVVAAVRAFTAALAPRERAEASSLFDDLRGLLLGSDIDESDTARLVERYRRFAEHLPADAPELVQREEELLTIFADVALLFRRQRHDEEGDPLNLSAGQYFLTYLRQLDAKGAGLPPAFVDGLERALAHYGSSSLDVTTALKGRLLWIYRARERQDTQVKAVRAILERRLRHANDLAPRLAATFVPLLDRIITATEHGQPALHDLAVDVRYRYVDHPLFERDRRAIYAGMERHLERLVRTPGAGARERDLRALVECPLPLGGLLAGRFESASPGLRLVMLDVLTRRFYRIRPLTGIEHVACGERLAVRTSYLLDARTQHLIATHAALGALERTLGALDAVMAEAPAGAEILLDLYVSSARAHEDADAMSARLAAMLGSVPLTRPVRRVVVALAGPRGEWAQSGTTYFTFRSSEEGWLEERLYRGLHPMMGKRLQLERLRHFRIDRLPSAEDVYLFRGVARDNPKDERLFALAEVRDLSAQYDEAGRVARLPHLAHMLLEALSAIREAQLRRPAEDRLHWNRVTLFVWPVVTLGRDDLVRLLRQFAPYYDGLGLERIALSLQMSNGPDLPPSAITLRLANPEAQGGVAEFVASREDPLVPLEPYAQKVVRMRQRGLNYPYEITRLIAPGREVTGGQLPPGEFVEHDLDDGDRLVPVHRPPGRNGANIVVGLVRSFTATHPDGMTRVIALGDPSREMGSIAEPECRRLLAGLDLAASLGVPFEWFALSAGAKISMESGTENMDWISRVLRRLIEFTQAGHEVNVVVTGINVGAQPYWNAEATMLMHTKGILVMMPESAMVLTGKTALDYSGSVSAEDNLGIGGYELVMGPNGQAQYWANDMTHACRILLEHYEHCYRAPGERFPRRAATSDPVARDVRTFPHGLSAGTEFRLVGDIFSDETNPGRKKPFDIRRVMLAVTDQDAHPLERWHGMRDAEVAVVWDAHIGGYPVALIGLESRSIARLGFVPTDGPDAWTSGTLFPMASKKVARAINAASDNRALVILANLSGFDGSPESMRRRQLEFGAEIGRAVVNFRGPIVFVVISRYHGGAFVVFSKALNDNMEVAALEGTYASVIGGAPAAAVVFAREVDTRTRKDPRVVAAEQELAEATDEQTKREWRARLGTLLKSVQSEKLGEVADLFDRTHSVQRALRVGSLDRIIPARELRPFLVGAIERGIEREMARLAATREAASAHARERAPL
jgi:acetyl/propionyl-CoA carboxylase alpha subunit/acetyl-CoA carboxylase carboxyltransferase component